MQVQVIDYQSKSAAQDFAKALKEIGFGVIANHPLNNDLINQTYATWEAFFALPEAEKEKYAFDSKTHSGFISKKMSETAKGYDVKDIKEFFHYYPHTACPDAQKALTQQTFDMLSGFASELLGWLEQHMPNEAREKLTMPLPDMIKDSDRTLFRLLHYPPLTGDEPANAIRAAAHEDIDLLTVLPAATAKGLQVQDADGNWLDVPCNPGWLIINIGDMLQEATGHFYPSTSHRVINPEGDDAKKSRLSMPLFLHPPFNVRLSEKHTARSYCAERYKELGLELTE